MTQLERLPTELLESVIDEIEEPGDIISLGKTLALPDSKRGLYYLFHKRFVACIRWRELRSTWIIQVESHVLMPLETGGRWHVRHITLGQDSSEGAVVSCGAAMQRIYEDLMEQQRPGPPRIHVIGKRDCWDGLVSFVGAGRHTEIPTRHGTHDIVWFIPRRWPYSFNVHSTWCDQPVFWSRYGPADGYSAAERVRQMQPFCAADCEAHEAVHPFVVFRSGVWHVMDFVRSVPGESRMLGTIEMNQGRFVFVYDCCGTEASCEFA